MVILLCSGQGTNSNLVVIELTNSFVVKYDIIISHIATRVHILVSRDFKIFFRLSQVCAPEKNREISHLETAFRKSAKMCTEGRFEIFASCAKLTNHRACLGLSLE